MSYKIISADEDSGEVTYEIDYGVGILREQLLVSDYPTAQGILARIEGRVVSVKAEVSTRRQSRAIPDEIKRSIADRIAAEAVQVVEIPVEVQSEEGNA